MFIKVYSQPQSNFYCPSRLKHKVNWTTPVVNEMDTSVKVGNIF